MVSDWTGIFEAEDPESRFRAVADAAMDGGDPKWRKVTLAIRNRLLLPILKDAEETLCRIAPDKQSADAAIQWINNYARDVGRILWGDHRR